MGGGEQIAVEAKSNMPGAQPEIKTYTADASGNLTSGVPSWWTNTSEQMTLRAWYCGDGSTAEGEANALTVPSEWSVQSDQSGEGATDGYKSSDLLFAPAMTSAFSGRAAVPLKFYHQTAKVVVNILNAKAVTDAAKIRAVRIGDGNMVLEAGFSAPVAGAAVGTWDTASAASDGTIIPHKLTKPAEPDYIATYVALVIPQPTADKLMVTVETVFGTMCYTAPEGAGHLEAGKVRTYNITVYTDRLEVSVADDSGMWTDGGSEIITSKYLVATYTADELKMGDYFYSDGSTSDGGVRGLWSDGSLKMAETKPEPVLTNPETDRQRTVVGIVFQTDPSRIGDAEKEALAAKGVSEPHGLVVAVKNNSMGSIKWCEVSENRDFEELTNCGAKEQCYNDISGLKNYNAVVDYAEGAGKLSLYPAFEAVAAWNAPGDSHNAPANTTGWFLPAAGQMYDFFANLGGLPGWDSAEESSGFYTWRGQTELVSKVNAFFSPLGEGNYDGLMTDYPTTYYWSSSEVLSYSARSWSIIYNGNVQSTTPTRSSVLLVRPVLAF